ncbi:YfiT family bacillithiol transferase [Chitinophaga sp. Hz27]|uniref:YfiT family bacillithiol transferase n=1 Tax=Chitinophaga sp. Hz27 TaxID=3347169 RepID=UPI0035DBA23A
MESLKYPIGRFQSKASYTQEEVKSFVNDIRNLPSLLEIAVQNLDEAQLETPYRPEGWTVTQLVHHVADSHVNAYIRLKLALTEERPIIKPYEEAEWAKLPDTAANPINVSITLLHALHRRWVSIFDNMQPEQWKRTYIHPASGEENDLTKLAALYSWHSMHHLAHIMSLKERMNWQ